MSNLDKETKKVLLGVLIGGAAGLLAAAVIRGIAHKGEDKNSSLGTLGNLLHQAGEIFEDHHINKPTSLLRVAEKKINQHENKIADALEWVSAGLHLWENLRKGK